MAANNDRYATGYKSTITLVGVNGNTFPSTTWSQGKYYRLPKTTAATVKTQHLGGFQAQPDGISDFGMVEISIPNSGQSGFADKQFSVVVQPQQGPLAGKTFTANPAYCVGDDNGEGRRGSTIDRVLGFDLLETEGAWT